MQALINMNQPLQAKRHDHRRHSKAFTLVEMLVAVSLTTVVFLALYLGFTQGFAVIQLARENLRATQILQEKTEIIRLYTWEQITNGTFIPKTFTAPFYATGTNQTGLIYDGRLTITNAPLSEGYASDLKLVIAEVQWISGSVSRHRSMNTLVSRYGLHDYIY